MAESITDAEAAKAMEIFRQVALEPEAIAQAIAHVITQSGSVDTSEIVVRPTAGF